MTRKSAKKYLIALFIRNGNARVKDPDIYKRLRSKYRKGYEVRFTAREATELKKIQAALSALDVKYGKPFRKSNLIVQPVYGKEFTLAFLDEVNRSA